MLSKKLHERHESREHALLCRFAFDLRRKNCLQWKIESDRVIIIQQIKSTILYNIELHFSKTQIIDDHSIRSKLRANPAHYPNHARFFHPLYRGAFKPLPTAAPDNILAMASWHSDHSIWPPQVWLLSVFFSRTFMDSFIYMYSYIGMLFTVSFGRS